VIDREQLKALIREVLREELATNSKPASANLVTVADYAAARSISASTVRKAIREKRLPSTKIGTAVRVPATAEIKARKDRASRILELVVGGSR
jgi:excisionase family DNA binding protein